MTTRTAAPAPVSHTPVVDALGRRITSGTLAVGDVLTLAEVEAEFQVSRTVARESARVLEAHGLIASRRRVGLVVLPRSEWDNLDVTVIEWMLDGPYRGETLLELTQLRTAVEPLAARLAALRATNAQRAELVRWADELSTLGGRGQGAGAEYLAADISYHSLLLESSGNTLFAQLTEPIAEVLRGRSMRGLTPSMPRVGTLEAHVRTAQAIFRGDAEAAEHAAREHLVLVAREVEPT
ncbi:MULTISPECIES: FadR/GntR family transcriptional regulator [unclassified Microbacterium]|uniref:FadR/GntR family transcriptional regulator n=1 Tax=unclassified Microbacterium TaxID=2609290 RepID=UPI00301B5607